MVYNTTMMNDDTAQTNDILYGELKMLQPPEGRGPRVNVDTVLLAHFARPKHRARVVEMGCAHGAIALIVARRWAEAEDGTPSPAIDAFDINDELIDLARRNAELNGLTERVRFFQCDLRDVRSRFKAETYDAVIMNPPYDEPGTSRRSPSDAMAAAMHGTECSLADAVAAAKYLLKNGGRFYLVMRARRAAEMCALLESRNVRPKRMRAVHPKPGREASVVLVEAVRDGGSGLTIEPPLFICRDDGEYTDELLAAYRIDEGRG